jgi:diguanylate cyclase
MPWGEQLAEHIWKLLYQAEVPSLGEDLKGIPLVEDIHRGLCEVRETLDRYVAGDLEARAEMRGILPGYLGELQAKFRELQAKEVGLRREADQRQASVYAMQEREYRFRALASRDPLTGVLNRRAFMRRAAVEIEAVYARKGRSCLAILDVDNFKQFNDRYGHPAGDDALKHIVGVLFGELRRTDFMGRYGGEEFVVLFPDTTLPMGQMVCERALKALALTPVQLETGPAALTASIGLVQTCWEAGEEPEYGDFSAEGIYLLVTQADRALYQAKLGGRNRAVSYSGGRERASV